MVTLETGHTAATRSRTTLPHGSLPRQLSDRLVVKPTWTEWDAAPGQVVIDVDPQMAFGTGEHATTRGCLRLLDSVVCGVQGLEGRAAGVRGC